MNNIEMVQRSARSGNATFAAMFSGACAAASVALLFLVIDSIRGTPLATPSLLGSALFLGEVPSGALTVRVDLVALYSLVHAAAFFALGAAATTAYLKFPALAQAPVLYAAVLTGLLSIAAALFEAAVPGAITSAGISAVLGANAIASSVLAGFIHLTVGEGHAASLLRLPVNHS